MLRRRLESVLARGTELKDMRLRLRPMYQHNIEICHESNFVPRTSLSQPSAGSSGWSPTCSPAALFRPVLTCTDSSIYQPPAGHHTLPLAMRASCYLNTAFMLRLSRLRCESNMQKWGAAGVPRTSWVFSGPSSTVFLQR